MPILDLLALGLTVALLSSCSISPWVYRAKGLKKADDAPKVAESVSFRTDESAVLSYSAQESPSLAPSTVEDAESEISIASAAQGTPGVFRLAVTDAPLDGTEAVYIRFNKVQITRKSTQQVLDLLASPLEINLMQLRDGLSQLFGQLSLEPDTYHQLRFFIGSVRLIQGGKTVQVAVDPRLSDQGLRIFGSFEVKAGAVSEATIDFDLARLLVWSKAGVIFRPVAKLRHLHLKPAGIHLEENSNGTLSLIGPARSVRARAWVQITDARGEVSRKRAASDGSFRFDDIDKVLGTVEFAVLGRSGDPEFAKHTNCAHAGRHQAFESEDGELFRWIKKFWKGPRVKWMKLAWIEFPVDFIADAKYPRIFASHLDRIFAESFAAAGSVPSTFLQGFKTDAFRYLAGLYVKAKGLPLPAGFSFPSLPVPYAFALEGPDYDLPGFAWARNDVGYYSDGPSSDGCSDARVLFEGSGANNDYRALDADGALLRMIEQGLPFTGLMAEYQSVCRLRDLASLSCSALGSVARAGNNSLPAETLSAVVDSLNSPRGGMLVALLACVQGQGGAARVSATDLPSFPSQQPGCWLGCAGDRSSYLAESDLLSESEMDAALPKPEEILDLDSLVIAAQEAQVSPLSLLASHVAYRSPSKVHGFMDRKAPSFYNLLPVSGVVTTEDRISVSGLLDDRTVESVTIQGVQADFALGADGRIHVEPTEVQLVHGSNHIVLRAEDEAGNIGQASLDVVANLPQPELSPSPSPAPSPSPSAQPSETPVPEETPDPRASPIPGVSALCSDGQFVPKPVVRLGLSIDPVDSAKNAIVSGFQSLGYSPAVYTDQDIVAGKLVQDGITILAIARKVSFGPVQPAYIDAVRAFVAQGGSLIGEYDGAALAFTAFTGSHAYKFEPPLGVFQGDVAGGGAVLPLINSTVYVSDANDPIMQGVPASFLLGVRAAFAVSGYNTNWLHMGASFTSTGYMGLVPAGEFPSVLSGRCGKGRVVLFTMTHFQVLQSFPANIMVGNAIRWVSGQ